MGSNNYQELKEKYDVLHSMHLCTKHFTFDSTFYIIPEAKTFRVIRFYNDNLDFRDLGSYDSPGIAYSEVMCGL